jgi:hypothetical protein
MTIPSVCFCRQFPPIRRLLPPVRCALLPVETPFLPVPANKNSSNYLILLTETPVQACSRLP